MNGLIHGVEKRLIQRMEEPEAVVNQNSVHHGNLSSEVSALEREVKGDIMKLRISVGDLDAEMKEMYDKDSPSKASARDLYPA